MLLLRLAKQFEKYKVPYAVVGGYAVALYGAVRGTVDLDIVVKLSKQNFIDAEKALQQMGLESRLPLNAAQVFDFREEYIKNKNLIAWSFFNPNKSSEIVDIVIMHDLKKLKVKKISLHGQSVFILDREALIAMKRASGRPQDLEDIKALEALKK